MRAIGSEGQAVGEEYGQLNRRIVLSVSELAELNEILGNLGMENETDAFLAWLVRWFAIRPTTEPGEYVVGSLHG